MTKKIKILYLTTTSQLSGAEKQLLTLVKGLNSNNYEILVCTIKDDIDNQLLDILRKHNIKTNCLNINKKWQFYKILKLSKIIRNFKPDIIQSFLYFDNILARLFGKLHKVPYIISGQRNVEIERSKIRNIIEKTTIPLADLIVANSEAGKDILVKREKVKPEKIKVIYNSIELKENNGHYKLDLNFNKNDKIIGFIGRLDKQKGLTYLIKAMNQLKEKRDDIKLVIIGDGKEKESLITLTKKLNLENNIYFLGHKNKAWLYLKNFDIFILPSLWEGAPNVILEAILNEIPVIATNVGGNPEIIENNKSGFLIQPKNSQEIAEKINYVLSLSPEKKERITKEAKRIVSEKFSVEKMIKEHENLYYKLITSHTN